MKLKKSFSVSLFLFSAFLFFSCASSFSLIPGVTSGKISNIYTEYYNLAESYYNLEDYTNASKYYNLAMNNRNNYWAAYYKLAKCNVFQGNWDVAAPMFYKLLKRDPENTSLKASLAYIYLMNNDVQKSADLYLQLLNEEQVNIDYMQNFVALMLANEKYLKKNQETFDLYYNSLLENYSDNEKTIQLKEKYEELYHIESEDTEEDSEVEEENSES